LEGVAEALHFSSPLKGPVAWIRRAFAHDYSQNAATCTVRICPPFQRRASAIKQRRHGPGVNCVKFLERLHWGRAEERQIAAVLVVTLKQEEHFAHEIICESFLAALAKEVR